MKRGWVNILAITLLVGFVIWAGKGIFKYSVFQTHDLKNHIATSFNAVVAIREGHFPLRWAGTMNYECGLPLFNFYYPSLYYLVVGVNVIAGSLLLSLKIISILSFLIGTLFFYLWMKEETNDIWASLAGAILYLYAPYRFLLVYVRGSPEYLSYAILPVVLYFFAKAFKEKENAKFLLSVFGAAIFGGLFVISHNIVSVFLMPIILLYLIVKFVQKKKLDVKRTLLIVFSYISAFGLGAFFIFPAFLEQKFTKLSIPIFNYQHHFPAFWQVLHSKWGYGDSAIGDTLDAMSFQLGYAHWIVLVIVLPWLVYILIKKRVFENIIPLLFFFLSLVFLYLVLPISLPVWERVKLLQAIQFPWRLLGVSVFTISALFTFWVTKIRIRIVYWIFVIGIVFVALMGNRNHLLSQPVLENDLPLYENLDKLTFPRRSLPGYAEAVLPPSVPQSCHSTTPIVSSDGEKDQIYFKEVERGSTFGLITVEFDKKKVTGNRIIFNLSYFPDMYHFKLNGGTVNYSDCSGRACLMRDDFREGENVVEWKVEQTKIQKLFNIVSLAFFIFWICITIYEVLKNRRK